MFLYFIYIYIYNVHKVHTTGLIHKYFDVLGDIIVDSLYICITYFQCCLVLLCILTCSQVFIYLNPYNYIQKACLNVSVSKYDTLWCIFLKNVFIRLLSIKPNIKVIG